MPNDIDKIIKLVKNLTDVTNNIDENYKIGPNSGWDSLLLISLIVMLKEELNIVLNLDFFSDDKTIIDICNHKNEK